MKWACPSKSIHVISFSTYKSISIIWLRTQRVVYQNCHNLLLIFNLFFLPVLRFIYRQSQTFRKSFKSISIIIKCKSGLSSKKSQNCHKKLSSTCFSSRSALHLGNHKLEKFQVHSPSIPPLVDHASPFHLPLSSLPFNYY